MKLIDIQNLQLYDSEIKEYFQRKMKEELAGNETIVQMDSLSSFPENGDSNILYIDTSTNQPYRWSEEYETYYPVGTTWRFVEMGFDQYSALSEKSSNTLYFLTNGQLYKGSELVSNVKVIQDEFPSVIDSSILGDFCISLTTGEIKYAGQDGYIDVSELMTQNIVLSQSNLKILVNKIAERKTITMPTMEVVGNKLVWTPSNVEEVEVLVPLIN
jgi:hypothetical protein